jgi:hypothetical protein
MDAWMGEDVHLVAEEGIRTMSLVNGHPTNNITNANHGRIRYNAMPTVFQKENELRRGYCANSEQFMVKATSRSPQRVSLADMGQIYISNKADQNGLCTRRKTFDCFLAPQKQGNPIHEVRSCLDT